jgi:hypothetical protein
MEKVDLSRVTADNRPELRLLGGTLGTKYFKAEARAAILNFEERKVEVERSGNIDMILNRTPRRFYVKDYDVQSVALVTDALGSAKVVLNQGKDEAVSIPISSDGKTFSNVTDDALGKALRGDQSIVFSNAKKLVDQINTLNRDEKERLLKLAEEIKKSIQQIDSAIASNDKKVSDYYKELAKSTSTDDSTTVVLNVDGSSETLKSDEIIVVNS